MFIFIYSIIKNIIQILFKNQYHFLTKKILYHLDIIKQLFNIIHIILYYMVHLKDKNI